MFWFLAPGPAAELLDVEEQHWADLWAEAMRLHKNGGYSRCLNFSDPADPCVFCNTHLGDPFYMWKLKIKMDQTRDSTDGENELPSDLIQRIRARAKDFRPIPTTPDPSEPITPMP